MYGGKAAGATREVVMPSIVEKCFGAMRAGTKKLAMEVTLLYAEMEDVVGCEGLIQDLLKGTAAKQPKVIATSVTALTELIKDFGPKQASPKLIVKKLPDLFGHSDKTVRAEASNLAKELHKWIGAALESTISTLKDIQAKELREQFAQLDAAGERHTAPSRYLTSQRPTPQDEVANAGEGQNGGQATGEIAPGAEAIDPLEFVEPADPLKSKDWPEDFDEKIASVKWLERKEVLAQCLKVLEATPKIIHTMNIDSVIDVLCEKIKKDSNINVALVACQCLARIATGLRSDFARNKDKALPALLDKLKEKKDSTLKVVSDTLDAVFLTMSIGDILEQTLNATKHKNPAVKSGSIQFLARCLKETRQMPAKSDVKPMADAFVVAIGDGSADVRDAGAQGLGTLMKLIGERPMNQYIDGLDDIKKAKIQEQYKEATVKVKQSSAPAGGSARSAAPAPAPASARPSMAPPASRPIAPAVRKPALVAAVTAEKENISPAPSSVPSRPPVKKPAPPAPVRQPVASSSRPPVRATPAASGSKPSKAASSTEPVKFKYHPDEAEAKASELVPSHLVEEISNSVWKERLAGMVKFNEWLKIEVEEVESELIVRFLSKKPGWKESNFQVMAEVYNSLRMLAQDCSSFARPSVALSVTPLCEKLGDIKLKGPAGETLTLYAEKTSFGFVLMQALTPLGNIKAPKAIADSLLWVNEAILAFGTSGVDVKSVIEYLLTCLKSANAGVRTNATIVIGTLARFLGSALTTFLGDLNPQLRSTIEAEIEKATKEPAPVPTRFSEESRVKAEASNGGGSNGASNGAVDEDALDSLIPRVDLDQIMPSSAISRMSDANWKERKEGLEEVNAILDANTRLKPNMGDLGAALKLRFSDSNIQVRTLALDAISKIATAMNKGFADHARAFVPPVTQVMTDAKAPIRASAARTLSAIVQQVGVGPMIPGFCSILDSKVANPMLKQDLFTWLGEHFEAHTAEKGMDLTGLALPAILCLDDKLAAVRKAAQIVLPFIIMRAGYKYVMEQTNGLKTASRNTVIPLIDAAKAQAASKQPKAAAPAPSAAPAARNQPMPSKTPIVARKQAYSSSSDGPPSGPPSEALPELPSATPRKGLMKPPSVVGRSLKPVVAEAEEMRSATPRMNIVKRPTMASQHASSSSAPVAKSAPFVSSDMKFKAMREKKESGSRGAYWIGPEAAPRPELTEILRHQCEHHLGVSLLDTMFSKDHNAERDYLSALTLMVDYVSNPDSALEDYELEREEAIARVMANSDLLFKYIALRLTDNNTSISLKCLDLTEQLIGLLRGQEYHMSDYEANAIIPCLIAKFGDPKPSFRDRIRQEIFRKLTFIYPPSKILTHYMEEGLPSKNARVRTECLAELGNLFNKNGPQLCSLPKVLPLIAQQISDRDNGVRTAALLAIGEVYKVVGEEETWRCVGKLPLKESGLLEERLRRTIAPAAPARAVPAPATVESKVPAREARQSIGPSTAAMQPAVTSSPSQPRKLPVPSRLARPASTAGSGIPPPSGPRMSRLPAPVASGIARPGTVRAVGSVGTAPAKSSSSPPVSSNGGPSNGHSNGPALVEEAREEDKKEARNNVAEEDVAVEQAINEILSSDSNRSVMALKQVDAEIQNLAPALLRNADQLTIAFGKQLHRAFRLDTGGTGNDRLKKNLLFTGISIFDNTRLWEDNETQRTLGSYVSKPALVSLLTELLQRLIETSGATDEETQAHGRYLNIIVLRTFSSCNLNVLFGACLAMLTEATEDLEELQNQGDEVILQKRVRFSELIIKCLWKITRKLHASLQDEQIDPTILLQDLERFMQAIPPNEWKRRASVGLPLGEMPLRTIKVIITHIGSCFGEEALDLLEGISNAEESYVYKFLLRVCDRSGTNNGLGVEGEDMATELPTEHKSPSVKQRKRASVPTSPSKNAVAATRSPDKDDTEAAVNAELRSIFDRIAQKAESRAAIKDLYLFQRRYPQKEANIQRSLESTGPIFQKFIKRALANHAAEDEQTSTQGDGGADRSPSLDSLMSSIDRRDSAASLVSPNSARSSAAFDWTATAAAINRSSVMTPPSARSSFTASSHQAGINPSSPVINTGSPNMQRLSATDDRLAQLRAKFARSVSGTSESSVS
jgi:cytoskeleton-associated protein 5